MVYRPLWKIWVRQLGFLFHSQLNGKKLCSKPPTRYRPQPDHHSPSAPPLPTTHLGRPIGSKGSQPQRQPTHGSSGLREGRRAELELEKCEKPVGDIMGYMKNEYTNNLWYIYIYNYNICIYIYIIVIWYYLIIYNYNYLYLITIYIYMIRYGI